MAGNHDAVNESLSAMLDGEHSELDLRRILKAAETDEQVGHQWAAYNRTRQLINRDLAVTCGPDFLAGIQQAIADEEVNVASNDSRFFQRYAGKVAVAACFTFVFLIGANQLSTSQFDTADASLAGSTETHQPMAVVPDGFELPPLTSRTVSSVPTVSNTKPSYYSLPSGTHMLQQAQSSVQKTALSAESQQKLQHLMLKHAEAASANGGLGVIPFARVNAGEAGSADAGE